MAALRFGIGDLLCVADAPVWCEVATRDIAGIERTTNARMIDVRFAV